MCAQHFLLGKLRIIIKFDVGIDYHVIKPYIDLLSRKISICNLNNCVN